MAHRAGGGIQSNKIVYRTGPKREPLAKAVDPVGVSHLGTSIAYKPNPLYTGKGFNSAEAGRPHNMMSGPGGGRVLYGQSGTNKQYGPANPGDRSSAPDVPGAKPGRDILRDYGPESK
jgi:hypothetical protein